MQAAEMLSQVDNQIRRRQYADRTAASRITRQGLDKPGAVSPLQIVNLIECDRSLRRVGQTTPDILGSIGQIRRMSLRNIAQRNRCEAAVHAGHRERLTSRS